MFCKGAATPELNKVGGIMIKADVADPAHQGVRARGVRVLELGVAIDVDDVGRQAGLESVVQGGVGPGALPVGRVQEAVDGLAPTLEFHIHGRPGEFPHEAGRH